MTDVYKVHYYLVPHDLFNKCPFPSTFDSYSADTLLTQQEAVMSALLLANIYSLQSFLNFNFEERSSEDARSLGKLPPLLGKGEETRES